jgi:hypothetical protein
VVAGRLNALCEESPSVIFLRFAGTSKKGNMSMNKLVLLTAAALLVLASAFTASATGLQLGSSALLSAFEVLPVVPVATKDKKGGKGGSKPTSKQARQNPNAPKQPKSSRQRLPEPEYY